MKKRWLAFVLTIVMLSSNLTPTWNAIALAEENTAVLSSEPVFSDASVEATVSDADASSGDNTLSVIEPLIVSEPVVTAAPTQAPTAAPTPVITEAPTAAPTPVATEAPTAAPTEAPAPVSEPAPIAEGTETPAAEPEATEAPTAEPTEEPKATEAPVSEPAAEPEATAAPTAEPAKKPETTEAPTAEPTEEPKATMAPTAEPAEKPEATEAPTAEPTATPEATEAPTAEPATTPEATEAPTAEPATTPEATEAPTAEPTITPEATVLPSVEPSLEPSASPEATVTPTPTPVPDPLVVSISISPSYMTVGGGTISANASISGGLGDYNVALYIFSPYTLDAEKSVTLSAPGNVSLSSIPVYGGTHTAEVIVTDASGQQAQASASMVVSEGFPESASVWESSISDVALTDDWVTDILAIARSQIGNREYENCFVVDESGRVRYYTRYGHWYGAPYQDWCAMFVAFCLHYADISTADYPVDAGCTTWKGKLEAIGAYEKTNNAENARRAENGEPLIIDEDAYLPTSGDLIFINHEGEPNPQHVGLVEYVEDGMVYTIEGNACNSVMRREYELTDVTIVGYGNTGLLAQRAKEKEEAQLDNPAQSETIPEQTPMAEGTIGRTTLKKVNMRSHTDVESKLLRTIVEPGTAVSVLFSVDVGSKPWYFVEYDGTNGYIRGDLLSIEEAAPEATVEPTPAPVYYCGSEGHAHAETCYAEDGSTVCEFPEHTHTEECLIAPEATVVPTVEPATIYYCGSEEHAHTEACYAEDGSIICEFPEHTHTEECLIAPEATVVPTVEPAPVYYCGSEEHAHTEACYAEDGSSVCEFPEHTHTEECLIAPEATVAPTIEPAPVYYCGSEEHAHAETCYAEDGSISCEFTEHTHTEECLVAPEATAEPTPAPVYYCSSEEHAHTEACYAEDGSIVCEFAEHTHTEECLAAPEATVEPTPAPVYYCGSEEHAHTEACYAEDGSIVCEFTEHTHTEECLIAPEATAESTPAPIYYCGSEEHVHAETCYAEDGSIVCEFTEHTHTEECLIAPEATAESTPAPIYYCGSEEHAHTEACYAEDGSIICEFPEHAHTEECLIAPEATVEPTPAPVYFCSSEEHTHAENCYAEDGSIICEFPEHAHTEECLIAPEATAEPTPAPIYYCGSEEHAHAENCYAEDGSIICELPEHTHSEDCLLPPPIILQLTLDQTSVFAGDQPIMLRAQVAGGVAPYTVEFSHTSTGAAQADAPAVYARRMVAEPQTESTQLTESGVADFAYQPEAAGTHTLAITVTDAAGTQAQAVTSLSVAQHDYHETEEDFLSSIAAATLTDNIRENIAAIAATQLGYTESTTDFIVDEAGQQQGYTRFGAWAQQPYTPWSASFVQFCLHYAGSAQTPVADAAALAAQLTATAQYRAAGAYVPLAGDVVFFDWDEDGLADHTGLIANAYPGENGYTIETIEGDVDGAVITRMFVVDATPSIVGYGQTAENAIMALITDVIAQIAAIPSADEIDTRIAAFEASGDVAALERWRTITAQRIAQAYHAYSQLPLFAQSFISSADKLMELEHIWSVTTPEELVYYCGNPDHQHDETCLIMPYEAILQEILALYEAHCDAFMYETADADAYVAVDAMRKRIQETYDAGWLNTQQYNLLNDSLDELLDPTPGEYVDDLSAMQHLIESGWFNEYSYAANTVSEPAVYATRMIRSNSAVLSAAETATVSLNDEPSDTQVDDEGGKNTSADGRVSVSKTIDGTDLENVFDITLTVETTQKIEEVYTEPDMAVVIVMDISNTMNSKFPKSSTTTTRYTAAIDSAEAFLDKFAAETKDGSAISKVGYVAFNTHAHEIFGLSNCSTQAEADGLKNIMRTQTGNIINNYTEDDTTRFTNVEAGLKMGYDMLASANNDNKYIIFLSDGFPTTYVSSGYNGYNPYYTGYGTPGTDGVFYDAVTGYYCRYGTSYSDKASIRAREQATAIKNAGAQIFSIGVDVGGQTIEGYDGRVGLSVIDRTGTTYEIGDASSTEAYKNWLRNGIGSGYYYDSTDSSGLNAAYDEIFKEIVRINQESSQADWVAEDPLPSMITDGSVKTVEFISFFDKDGNLHLDGNNPPQALDLSGTSTEDGENTASYDQEAFTIDWDMKDSGYTSTVSGNVTTYKYELMYRVRLQNEDQTDFVEHQVYPTNATTTLTYKILENNAVSAPQTINFPIPEVHGYLGELSFKKVDSFGNPVAGAELTLSHDTAKCTQCRGDGSSSVLVDDIKVSGADGMVHFTKIPSGHTYKLEETKIPAGYWATGCQYTVVVAYDTTTVTVTDKDGNSIEWNGEFLNHTAVALPETGGRGTLPYTVGGLLLIVAATGLLYNQFKRRREGTTA